MGNPAFNDAVIACLGEIHKRLSEAAEIAKAAEACALTGEGCRIDHDFDGH
ncbi:uncharacterized protein YeaC (DUF1315 family) [Bradyrhizobium sp. LB9.1b]